MYHLVARTSVGLLFTTWEEAHALWGRITRACPGMEALCLMPNHVHLQHRQDLRVPLAQALRGHSRSLNAAQGLRGNRIEPLPAAHFAADAQKRRRETRYIHLNPCRARLVDDPLAWPWSTYRDAVGLALRPVRARHPDPERLHAYTSSDPSVNTDGSGLPARSGQDPTLHELRAAVSGYTRTPLLRLDDRGAPRRLLLQSARALVPLSTSELARQLGTSPSTLRRLPPADRHVDQVARLVGDLRFPGVPTGRGYWTRR